MNTLITLYTITGLLILAFVIVKILFDNKFTRKEAIIMCIFPFHTLIAFAVCLVSYSTLYFIDKKRNGGE